MRYVAVDLDERMLERCARRAAARSLDQVELVRAEHLPAPRCWRTAPPTSASAPAACTWSRTPPPPSRRSPAASSRAASCSARRSCRRSARQHRLFEVLGTVAASTAPAGPAADALLAEDAGIGEIDVTPERGFAVFRGRKRPAPERLGRARRNRPRARSPGGARRGALARHRPRLRAADGARAAPVPDRAAARRARRARRAASARSSTTPRCSSTSAATPTRTSRRSGSATTSR